MRKISISSDKEKKKYFMCLIFFLLLVFIISLYNYNQGSRYFGDGYDISALCLQAGLSGNELQYKGHVCNSDFPEIFTSHSQTRPVYPILLAFTNTLFNNIVVSASLINFLAFVLSMFFFNKILLIYRFTLLRRFCSILLFVTIPSFVVFLISATTDILAFSFFIAAFYYFLSFDMKLKKDLPVRGEIIYFLLFSTFAIFTREQYVLVLCLPFFYFLKNILFKNSLIRQNIDRLFSWDAIRIILMGLIPLLLFVFYLYFVDLTSEFISGRYNGPILWSAENNSRTVSQFFVSVALAFGPSIFISFLLFTREFISFLKFYYYESMFFVINIVFMIAFAPFLDRLWLPISFVYIIILADGVFNFFKKKLFCSMFFWFLVFFNLFLVIIRIII